MARRRSRLERAKGERGTGEAASGSALASTTNGLGAHWRPLTVRNDRSGVVSSRSALGRDALTAVAPSSPATTAIEAAIDDKIASR